MKSVLSTSVAMMIALAASTVTRTGDGSPLVDSENIDATAKLLQIQSTGSTHVAAHDENLASELKKLDAEVTNFTYDGQVVGSVADIQARSKFNVSRIAEIAERNRKSIFTNYRQIMATASTTGVTDINSGTPTTTVGAGQSDAAQKAA